MGNRSPLDGKVVLVVDDEPDVLDTVAETLDMTVVHKAGNFNTALDCLQKNSYDLVILDIMGVNGFELLKHSVAKGLLTVMLTAHAVTLEALRESMKLGAAAFLPKEYMAELKEVLEDVIQGRKIRFWWRKALDRTGAHSTFGSGWKEKDSFFHEFEESLRKKEQDNPSHKG
jgi:DNA-binding NtrC family response regulator